MKTYALGLDLGIASIGWAVGPLDTGGNILDIEALGTFCYPSPISEVSNGRRTTNRTNRGAKRRARHRLHHFKARRAKLLRELIRLSWWPENEAEQLDLRTRKLRKEGGRIELVHPIALKVKGLTQRLEPFELGCVALHYQRHRGYLSTADLPALLHFKRKSLGKDHELPADDAELTEAQKEIRGLNNWINATRDRLGNRTVSEFQLDLLEGRQIPDKNERAVRARLSPPNRMLLQIKDEELRKKAKQKQAPATDLRYDRWMYIEEFDRLWDKQAEFYPEMSDSLRETIESLIFHQDPLDSKEADVGYCEILPTYRRCRTGELVFQRHRILCQLAHSEVDGRKLTQKERQQGLEFLMERDRATFGQLKSAIGLTEASRFKDEPLRPLSGTKAKGKSAVRAAGRDFIKGSAWGMKLAKLLEISGADLAGGKVYDHLVHDLLSMPESSRRDRLVSHYGIDEDTALLLMGIEPPKGYGKRCSRVLRRIEPFLLTDPDLHSATRSAGYKPADERPVEINDALEVLPEWTTGNPSVDSAVRWSVKVINQVIARYGKPAVIKVELPRQMAMGNEQRAELWASINEKAKRNEGFAKRLEEAGRKVSGNNLKRMQLAEECGWRSPYEPTKQIASLDDLIDNYDLDHIVPQSYSAEDGLANLVLCPTSLNQAKRSQTPYEAFGHDGERWPAITAFIQTCSTMPKRKRERILSKERPEVNMEARMITQMGYIGKQITSLLRTLDTKCEFVNGQVTAQVRRQYGLETLLPKEENKRKLLAGEEFASEKNRDDLRHHALDAASVILVDRSMYLRLTRYFKAIEEWKRVRERGERPSVTLEEPFPGIRAKLASLLPSIPVVRAPNRRATGALHKETMLPLAEFKGVSGVPGDFAVRGAHVLRFGLDGYVNGAWLKSSVHHGKLYRLPSGKVILESVSLFEVAERLAENRKRIARSEPPRPLIDKSHPSLVANFLMSLSNGDTVEYLGEKGDGPGFYRIGTIAVGKQVEISMFPSSVAKSEPKAKRSFRVTSESEFKNVGSRVILNIFGEAIFREPASDN